MDTSERDYQILLETYYALVYDEYVEGFQPPTSRVRDVWLHMFALDTSPGYITVARSRCCGRAITYKPRLAPKSTALAIYSASMVHTLEDYSEDYTPPSGYICSKCSREVDPDTASVYSYRAPTVPTLVWKSIPASDGGLGGYLVTPRSQSQEDGYLLKKKGNYFSCYNKLQARNLDCQNIYRCKSRPAAEKHKAKASEAVIGETSYCSLCPPYSQHLGKGKTWTKRADEIAAQVEALEELDLDIYM